MEAGAASARGVRGAKTRQRAGKQNCCEKSLHVSSVSLGRTAAPDHDSNRVIRQRRKAATRTASMREPDDRDLHAE
jgi:hypothetical protein